MADKLDLILIELERMNDRLERYEKQLNEHDYSVQNDLKHIQIQMHTIERKIVNAVRTYLD